MMKKVLAIGLAVLVLVSFARCAEKRPPEVTETLPAMERAETKWIVKTE